jgi:hypothetical protein
VWECLLEPAHDAHSDARFIVGVDDNDVGFGRRRRFVEGNAEAVTIASCSGSLPQRCSQVFSVRWQTIAGATEAGITTPMDSPSTRKR